MEVWQGWVFGHALHPLGQPRGAAVRASTSATWPGIAGAVRRRARWCSRDRHTYEVAANWKVIAENYHECYHCPLIHPELCQVTPPDSGDNYDLPGAWVGGSMDLRDGMATMSLTGELAATPLPGVDPTAVEYLHLLPNLLVSAHPDYVMAHRLVPLAPGPHVGRVLVAGAARADGGASEAPGAVEFWDITNKQDWAACESVQRGLASPHFRPGPFAPNEDAVAAAGGHDRPGLPPGTVPAMSGCDPPRPVARSAGDRARSRCRWRPAGRRRRRRRRSPRRSPPGRRRPAASRRRGRRRRAR